MPKASPLSASDSLRAAERGVTGPRSGGHRVAAAHPASKPQMRAARPYRGILAHLDGSSLPLGTEEE